MAFITEQTELEILMATDPPCYDLGPIDGAPAESHDKSDDPHRQRDDRRDRHHIEHLRCSQPEQQIVNRTQYPQQPRSILGQHDDAPLEHPGSPDFRR